MTKISLLPEMLRADLVAGDLLPIVDVSAGATKRIRYDALMAAVNDRLALLPGRNVIINGQGRINQRVYVSGTATVAANQYTLDRWRVVTSGQSLTWTGNAARNVMTAPAGGVEQVVESLNIEGGTYTINWTGTAACTVAGVARAKGEVFTLTAATNTAVRLTGGTFTDVQLELSSTPTAFERAYYSDELARSQRYYEVLQLVTGTTNFAVTSQYRTVKRVSPALSVTFDAGTGATYSGLGGGTLSLHQPTAHSQVATATVRADAEIL